jgi:hypothetical protein
MICVVAVYSARARGDAANKSGGNFYLKSWDNRGGAIDEKLSGQ